MQKPGSVPSSIRKGQILDATGSGIARAKLAGLKATNSRGPGFEERSARFFAKLRNNFCHG
jgi:hypothetical protein